jgi:hypothetical protein
MIASSKMTSVDEEVDVLGWTAMTWDEAVGDE